MQRVAPSSWLEASFGAAILHAIIHISEHVSRPGCQVSADVGPWSVNAFKLPQLSTLFTLPAVSHSTPLAGTPSIPFTPFATIPTTDDRIMQLALVASCFHSLSWLGWTSSRLCLCVHFFLFLLLRVWWLINVDPGFRTAIFRPSMWGFSVTGDTFPLLQ